MSTPFIEPTEAEYITLSRQIVSDARIIEQESLAVAPYTDDELALAVRLFCAMWRALSAEHVTLQMGYAAELLGRMALHCARHSLRGTHAGWSALR